MPSVPPEEIERRIAALQSRLSACHPPLDAALLVQGVDLFYFAGTVQSSHLLVPAAGPPRLLVRRVLERARDDSPLPDLRPLASLKALPAEVRAACGEPPWRIGMEADVLPVASFETYRALFGREAEIRDVSPEVLAVRSVKSSWEIDRIREAASVNLAVFREMEAILVEGATTAGLEAALDFAARRAGHLGVVRFRGFNVDGKIGLVVSGPTGAAPGHLMFPIGGRGVHPACPHGGDLLPVGHGVPVCFDYLANRGGYHHDQTRMAVRGTLPEEAAGLYEAMRRVLRRIEASLRPGQPASRAYEVAMEEVRLLGLERGFEGAPGLHVGFVGHSIGLEVNETPVLAPRFDAPIREGMVFAVEPKFTHPDLGVIGLENTYVIRAEGPENLGTTPEEVVRT